MILSRTTAYSIQILLRYADGKWARRDMTFVKERIPERVGDVVSIRLIRHGLLERRGEESRLARHPQDITLKEIILAADGPLKRPVTKELPAACAGRIDSALAKALEIMDERTSRITLQTLIEEEKRETCSTADNL